MEEVVSWRSCRKTSDAFVVCRRVIKVKLKLSTLTNSDIHFSGLTDEGLECSGADGGLDDVSHLETGL